ncbi:hypothetical protein AbraIFM66950_003288 [Aspergillus brasiliensis]|nr:hypothetical protein AbraIFM66950_003288 [Aspergillus brasiliensis]
MALSAVSDSSASSANLAEARDKIERFLIQPTEVLLLKLSLEDLTKEIRLILNKAQEKRVFRWEYDPDYEILKVKGMGFPLHADFDELIQNYHNACTFRSRWFSDILKINQAASPSTKVTCVDSNEDKKKEGK